jgi:hypothetical protein
MDKIKIELLIMIKAIRVNLNVLNKKNLNYIYLSENKRETPTIIYVKQIINVAQEIIKTINHIERILAIGSIITKDELLEFSDDISLAFDTSDKIFIEISKILRTIEEREIERWVEKGHTFNILSPKRKVRKSKVRKVRKSRKVRKV